MANYTVSAESLRENSIVFIKGKLGYSRLCSLIEGTELQTSDARRIQNGMNAVGRPHTTATITHAEVLPESKDPNNLTPEEQFVAERRYTSKKYPNSGLNYSIDSKGSTLPIIGIPNENKPGTFTQDTSRKELASGLDVTLVLRVYKPKNYTKRGLALEQVLVNEPVRYYGGSPATEKMVERGIVFDTAPQALSADSAPAPQGQTAQPGQAGQAQPQVSAGTIIDDSGLPMPAPGGFDAAAQSQQQAPVQPQPQGQVATAAPTAVPAAAPADSAVTSQPAQSQQQPEETMEQKLARLERENAHLRNADAPAPANPWNTGGGDSQAEQTAGITYQG